MGCVYMVRHRESGRCYIGKTLHFETRRAWHIRTAARGEGYRFHNALRRHGIDAFDWSILYEADDDGALFAHEIAAIVEHNARAPHGYNLTRGGDGVTGITPEARARIVAFHTGRKRSDETRKRQSDAARGKQNRLGAVLSDETKRKISQATRGRTQSDEMRAKISRAMTGRPKTEAQKSKMSEARKRWWERRHAAQGSKQLPLFGAAG